LKDDKAQINAMMWSSRNKELTFIPETGMKVLVKGRITIYESRGTYQIDVYELKKIVTTEFNIEGNCTEQKFVDLVLETKPEQVTLVPDTLGQLTSDHGWDTIKNKDYLENIISVFKKAGIRVSIFVDPDIKMVEGAAATGTDRIELYTEGYAKQFAAGSRESAVKPYIDAALKAKELGLGINAGHDLDRQNLQFFKQQLPWLDEVSIGHALVCDALYVGFENAVQLYKRQLQ
jgi:pyridoxine 5-phosphate synthase